MDSTSQNPTNLQKLKDAGIINKDYTFPPNDVQIIESLTTDEVNALIAIGDKLGQAFLNQHGGGKTAGILF